MVKKQASSGLLEAYLDDPPESQLYSCPGATTLEIGAASTRQHHMLDIGLVSF